MGEYSVYMHIFPNEKKYIGCAKGDIKNRWGSGHGYNGNKEMFADILFYGWKNIKHEILFDNLSQEEAYKIESELILKHKTYKAEYGYNRSQGSIKGVKHHSQAGIEKIRNAMASRTVSEESRRKMSVAKVGTSYHTQKHSEETKLLISKNRKGKATKENHPMARAVYCVELDQVFAYAKLAEEVTGVNRSHICQVCKGQRKTAGKMHWKYADEAKASI